MGKLERKIQGVNTYHSVFRSGDKRGHQVGGRFIHSSYRGKAFTMRGGGFAAPAMLKGLAMTMAKVGKAVGKRAVKKALSQAPNVLLKRKSPATVLKESAVSAAADFMKSAGLAIENVGKKASTKKRKAAAPTVPKKKKKKVVSKKGAKQQGGGGMASRAQEVKMKVAKVGDIYDK